MAKGRKTESDSEWERTVREDDQEDIEEKKKEDEDEDTHTHTPASGTENDKNQ